MSNRQPKIEPYHLDRLVNAQHPHYTTALNELRKGRKRSDSIWFGFPQVDGLGSSLMAGYWI